MLILHPDSAIRLAHDLHQERLAQATRARRAPSARGSAAESASTAVRQLAGRTFIRIGGWLLGPAPAPTY
jgi:hypothetical protein